MEIWDQIKEGYKRINWLKVVMSVFTLIVLSSYTIVTLQNKEVPALDKLNYFYKWAIGTFAVLHEVQRWLFVDNERKPSLTIVQGETYVTLFILVTISLLFVNVVWSDIYTTLPKSLNELIELSIWVAGSFGFSRLSKNFSENNKATNLARLSGSLNKLGFKPPDPPAADPK